MTHEIEFVKLEEGEEQTDIILAVKMTRYSENKSKLKFEAIWSKMSLKEKEYLDRFLEDKVIKNNHDMFIEKKNLK